MTPHRPRDSAPGPAPAPIEMEGVTLRYGAAEVLSGFTLSVRAGEVLALLGPSGSGKTSALRAILGLVAPERGAVRLDGETVSGPGKVLRPPEERNLAVVFQDLALWPHLTVHGNLAFGLDARRVPREERETRIAEMLGRVGLAGKERRHPGDLSGGERQRVAIARALVLRPRAILLDEPLSNLDIPLRRELITVFRELFHERRATVIDVTHDLREAAGLGDRIAVVEQGRVTRIGALQDLAADPGSVFVRDLLEDARLR